MERHKPGDFPVTEYVGARTIGLPFFSKMTANLIDRLDKMLTARNGRF